MQNLQQNEIPIHDIKPLVEIYEYSLYYLIGVTTLVSIVVLGAAYLAYKWYQNKKRFNKRAEDYKALRNVDFSDAKKAAYEITLYGATFKDDSERHKKAYENMLEKLEQYKYKKEVPKLDDETMHYIELFEGLIDV
ncbi:hypothetical protein [Sulfurimonas sp.]|uniref:hypothetical protein n=1 Tax=Sulfurimonas sp. TaxID=2022749 RepID=UPI00263885D6|nr:hypothetical protein [Sulfurimonas sp.]